MGDFFLIIGGGIFLVLAVLCLFRRDLVWKLYSLEPRWRRENPERTDTWDRRTKKSAVYYALVGIGFVAFGLLI